MKVDNLSKVVQLTENPEKLSLRQNNFSAISPLLVPIFQLLKRGTSIAPSPELNSATSSRESAFSFHQNPRTCILFAKNNISVYFGGREQQGF